MWRNNPLSKGHELPIIDLFQPNIDLVLTCCIRLASRFHVQFAIFHANSNAIRHIC